MSSSQAATNGMNGGNEYAAYNESSFIDDNLDDTVGINNNNNTSAAAAAAAAVRDDVYCHLTARRAVARAALYLGTIDSMSVEALDTLAGVLLAYLSRIGQTLAACTEASGRSSAHVHVLDCIRAVELCTEAAVQRVHFEGGGGGAAANANDASTIASSAAAAVAAAAGGADATTASGMAVENAAAAGSAAASSDSARRSNHARIDPADQTSWKGLAAFCFGPNWHEPLAASSALETQNGGGGDLDGGSSHGGGVASRRRGSLGNSKQSAAGGKVGPSSLVNNTNAEMMMIGGGMGMAQRDEPLGWDAPYPEDIPAWPVVSNDQYQSTANPHTMSRFTVESLHNHHITTASSDTGTTLTEEEQQNLLLNEIPDAAFFAPRTAWGRLPEPGASEKAIVGATSTSTAAAAAAAASEAGADSTTAAAGKRKQAPSGDEQDDSDSLPAKKKAKFSDDNDKTQPTMADDDDNAGKDDKMKLSTTTGQSTAAAAADDQNRRPFYVPRHFPPFPRPADAVGRTVLDDDTLLGAVQTMQQQQQQAARKKKNQGDRTGASRTPSSSRATTRRGAKMAQKTGVGAPIVNVRSALVRLGTPWGSGWDKDPAAASDALSNDNNHNNNEDYGAADDANNNDVDSSSNTKINVPVGRTEQPRDSNDAGGGQAQIVPLNRASGSRVSRILEGSMDAAPVM